MGEQLDLQFFSSIYKYGSKCCMSQPSIALVTAVCVAPDLLRVILFAFMKLFPSLKLSQPPRLGKLAAVRLSVVFPWPLHVGASQTKVIL